MTMRLTWPFKLGGLLASIFMHPSPHEISCSGQVLPLHPLDVTPTGLIDASTCVGSFIPQTVSVGAGELYVHNLALDSPGLRTPIQRLAHRRQFPPFSLLHLRLWRF